jgi:hypothetical protein
MGHIITREIEAIVKRAEARDIRAMVLNLVGLVYMPLI